MVAEIILDHTGILDFFKFVVDSDNFKNRSDMVEFAVNKAKEEADIDKVFVIGDSTRDIDAARGAGISIIVETGIQSKETILSHKPDHFVRDLSNVKTILGG